MDEQPEYILDMKNEGNPWRFTLWKVPRRWWQRVCWRLAGFEVRRDG